MNRVARYAARRVPADDIHDVLAETFLTAWRRLDEVPDDAIPWLFAAARRHIANRYRSTRRRHALNHKLLTTQAPIASQPLETEVNDIDEDLVAAIRRLPFAEREAFMLVAWDGLSPKRAARAAGCNEATFRVRLHRARRRLKGELMSRFPDRLGQVARPNSQVEEVR